MPRNEEVKINEIISLGENGGAGNLIICEIILMHIDQNILDEKNFPNFNLELPLTKIGSLFC